MSEGSTGLNIKDYPFAFSITALFFPNLLNDTASSASILGVLFIGGIFGSLLTIINPINRIITYHSKRNDGDVIYNEIFMPLVLLPINNLIKKIVVKNFTSALSSPQITFENNKTIAMLYFIIILGVTIIRSFFTDFTAIFDDNQFQIWGIRIIASIGLIAVVLVMLNHVYGINFKFSKLIIGKHDTGIRKAQISGLSQLDRINCVTVANLAIDFANLSNEGLKWATQPTVNEQVSDVILREFYKFNQKVEKIMGSDITASFYDFNGTFNKESINKIVILDYSWHVADIQNLFSKYQNVKEISITYDVEFSEALSWFSNRVFFPVGELYEMEPPLRSAIESRDWETANLTKYRITDKIRFVLGEKSMPKFIDDTWKVAQ